MVCTGLLAVANKHPELPVGYTGLAELGSRSRDVSAGRADPVAVHIGLDHTQAKGHILLRQGEEGSCSSMDNTLLAAEGIPRPEQLGSLGS